MSGSLDDFALARGETIVKSRQRMGWDFVKE
jgi:hypothetical protein